MKTSPVFDAAPSADAVALNPTGASAVQPVAYNPGKLAADTLGGGSAGLPAATDDKDDDQPTGQASAPTSAAPAATDPAVSQAAAAVVRGSPQTVANLAAQIIKKLDARSSQFDVQLDPAGLGKVDVRIAIGADGKMSAAMSFDTPQAAAELRSRSGDLQKALEQSGFDVSGGMSFDVASDSGQGRQAQDQSQSNAGAAFRGRAFQAALDTAADAAPAPQLTLRRTALSGVDIRI